MSATITIAGNLASDPEMKFLSSGKAVCSLTVMSSKSKKVDDKWESTEVTAWSIETWDVLAENVSQSLFKGDSVVVHGTIYQESWEDAKTGQKRSKMKVRASNVGADLKRNPVSIKRENKVSQAQKIADEWNAPLGESENFPF